MAQTCFFICAGCGLCVDNSGVMSWRDSSLRSCCHVWTIVMPYLPDCQCLHWHHYSGYCTLPLELSWTSDHATMCLPPCENYITALVADQAEDRVQSVPAHPQFTHIGHSPAYISDLLTSVADVPGRPALRTASRGDFIVPRTNRKFGEHSVSPLHECGIDCQPTSDSCVRRRHSGAILRHFYSCQFLFLPSSDKQTFM